MATLLKCEFKKFNNTYMNSLSIIGMLSPAFLVFFMYLLKKEDFIANGSYTWASFNQNLLIFFVLLVGPIITSFIAVFSIYYEYQQGTIKTIVSSPHSRSSIILVKVVHVSLLMLGQYLFISIINIIFAWLLGFNITWADIIVYTSQYMLAGVTTMALVPLMIFLTLLFRSFIPPMVITIVGTIANVLLISWDKGYISPWALPALLSTYIHDTGPVDIHYPVAFLTMYFIIFLISVTVFFSKTDIKA